MVATDGAGLHVQALKFKCQDNLTLKARGLRVLGKMAGADDYTISVAHNNAHVMFSRDNLSVIFRNVDVDFPSYIGILEAKSKNEIIVDGEVLKASVDQVLLISELAEFVFNGHLSIKAADYDKGEYQKCRLPFKEGSVSPEVQIFMDAACIKKTLTHVGKTVKIGITNPEKPVFFSDGDFRSIVMGVRC